MMKNKLFWLFIWGITFGYIESSIVVYLRELYYPNGFSFPIIFADATVAITEIIRELATLIIIAATAVISYPDYKRRFAVYVFIFGVWDIFYYVFLKIILNWPENLFTWDILFLIPLPWVGPVWAPLLVSLGLIAAGILILKKEEDGEVIELDKKFWIVQILCGVIIIISFIIPGLTVLEQSIPFHYPWYLFFIGFISGLLLFIKYLKRIN